MNASDFPVVTKEAVLGRLRSQNCRVVSDDFPASILLEAPDKRGFFIPKPLTDGGYTLDQMMLIEQTLACRDLELLPLDPYLH